MGGARENVSYRNCHLLKKAWKKNVLALYIKEALNALPILLASCISRRWMERKILKSFFSVKEIPVGNHYPFCKIQEAPPRISLGVLFLFIHSSILHTCLSFFSVESQDLGTYPAVSPSYLFLNALLPFYRSLFRSFTIKCVSKMAALLWLLALFSLLSL